MSQEEYRAYEARRNPMRPVPVDSGFDEPESELQQSIETYLKSLGVTCWYARCRMNKATTFTRKGIPDFFVIWKWKPYLIECKRKGEKPTPEQAGELHWARLAGARTAVVTTLEEVVQLLRQ
jgi:hypothetical protein